MSFIKELKRRNVFRVGIAYTVATWLLIQVADIIFPRIGLPDSAVTLVIALLAIGFIPALIFAWAFEMTPDGIKREQDVDRSQSITPNTARKLDRMIILILAVVVVWFLIDEFYLEPNQPEAVMLAEPSTDKDEAAINEPQSIAVLPFVNMSTDVENEYFSDGISEELLNVLVKVSTLHVASRTSAFAYKGKDLPISQIARELKVDNVLEGSVRKSGNRVRITAQLINADTDRHLWSETYERELVDIFDIQEEISNSIVAALKVVLNVDETAAIDRAQRPTQNAEAYELYLQGRFAWRQRHEENILKSIELFEQALAIDPDFARAHGALAAAWAVLPAWSDREFPETSAIAKPHAIRALELDPALSEARAVLAEIALEEHEWHDGLEQYRIAIEADPREPTLHQWNAEALTYMGFLKKGLEHQQIAYDLDPASPVINQSLAYIASVNRQDDLALKHIEISKNLGVGNQAILAAWDTLVRVGQLDRAFVALEEIGVRFTEIEQLCLQAITGTLSRPQLAQELNQFHENLDPGQDMAILGQCFVYAGQPEKGAQLIQMETNGGWSAVSFFWESHAQAGALRQTQAFRDTLKDMGLLDFYRSYGWPDLCRPLGDDDFECDT